MPLTKNILNLIKNITENNSCSLEENAKLMNVSERSLRYKIEDWNYYLKSLTLPEFSIKLGQIKFSSTIEDVVKKIRENISTYTFAQEEREKIELTLYLFNEKPMTIEEISEFLGVSSVTLKTDLKKLREYFNTYMLNLENTTSDKILKITGKEENIRKLILDVLIKNYDIQFKEKKIIMNKTYYYGYFIPWEKMDSFFKEEEIEIASKILNNILREENKKITDNTYKILFFNLLISLNRKEKNPIDHVKNKLFLKNTVEYSSLARELKEYDFSEEETLHLTEYFLGSNTFNGDNSFYGNWVQIEIFVMSLIKEISKLGYPEIEKDIFLIEGLINHIKPAIYRAKMKERLDTDIYDEFKKSYPVILSQVEESWKKCDFKDINISDEEMAYIAMHFQLATKRIKTSGIKNILIVCGAGYSTSKFLAESITERFSVNIIDTIPFNALENYSNINSIDLIITTIDKLENMILPVIKVSPILNKEDILKLEELNLSKKERKIKLTELIEITKVNTKDFDEEKYSNEILNKLKGYIIDDRKIDESLSFLDMLDISRIKIEENTLNWEEAITKGSDLLVAENIVTKDYSKAIIDLINKFGSYMIISDEIILAHAKSENMVAKTGISLLYLKDSVEFLENEKIKLVITIASKDQREHLNGLMKFVNLINEVDLLEKLKDAKTATEIYIIIGKMCE